MLTAILPATARYDHGLLSGSWEDLPVGAFSESGTNVNTMVVPGYVSQVHTVFRTTGDLLMPCHEYCGLGHSQMLARVRVVPVDQFQPGPDGSVSCG